MIDCCILVEDMCVRDRNTSCSYLCVLDIAICPAVTMLSALASDELE